MLHIGTMVDGSAFALPLELVTQTVAILAKRGVGKSYTASVMAEEMLAARQQVIILDPTGAWYGLRSSADGERDGFPVLVAGGDHADIPLEEAAGELLASVMVEKRFSAVLDLSLMRKGQASRFVATFGETLYRLNRNPLHLIVDEADAFAPQRVMGDEARACGAMEDLVRRGRKRGIGCTLITQRPAVLNKSVLTQCEMLVALRMTHPRDIDAIEEWVNVHADPDQAKEMIASLPSLPIGTAWFWSPGWGDVFARIEVRKRKTFDSGATPKPGQVVKEPKRITEVDVQALGKEIAGLAEKAKANDPAALKRRIADLERQAKMIAPAPAPAKIKRVEVPAWTAKDREMFAKYLRAAEGLRLAVETFTVESREVHRAVSQAAARVGACSPQTMRSSPSVSPTPPDDRPRIARAPQRVATEDHGALGNGGLRRMLIALAQDRAAAGVGMSARKLGCRAGLSSNSGTFAKYLGRGRSACWIIGERERLTIGVSGLAVLGHYDPLPTGEALVAYWYEWLGGAESGVARMFKALVEAYPQSLDHATLGERAQLTGNSGTFAKYLGRLRTLELVQGRGEIKANPELVES